MENNVKRVFEDYSKSSSSSDEENLDSSSSSSDDEEMENLLHFYDEQPSRVEIFENINNYSESQFKSNYRLSRNTANLLIDKYEQYLQVQDNSSALETVTAKVQILMMLWYIANQETFRQVAERFGYPKCIVYRRIFKVFSWIASELSDIYLKWSTSSERNTIQEEFRERQGIPNVVGAIDCSHIRILAPLEYKTEYYNRKQFYSIHLQAVVDDRKKLLDVCVGEPGSLHDSRVLRKSGLFKNFHDHLSTYMDENQFLLGDLAYPACHRWLVPPYKDFGSLTAAHRKFNYKHSSTRIVVEQAFALLKGRFRRLKFFENRNLDFIKILVIAAAVLHNMCIELDDYITITNNDDDDDTSLESPISDNDIIRTTRRDDLFRELKDLGILN